MALEPLGHPLETAADGSIALDMLERGGFALMLLDIRMPGLDGMEVLRRVAGQRPELKVVMITAHGTVDTAVEAMKLGVVDFIQKPFAADAIRALVAQVMDRRGLDENAAREYGEHFELAKRCVQERRLDAAVEHVRKAIALDSSRPEAFNLLGGLLEVQGFVDEARKNYRVALSLSPSYKPAQKNMDRLVAPYWVEDKSIAFGDLAPEKRKK
jgi:FixJ family two-component response regulator